MKFSLSEILTLMDKMQATNLGELVLEDDSARLKIKAKEIKNIVQQATQDIALTNTVPLQSNTVVTTQETEVAPSHKGNEITSPIVGTFYASSAPDKHPFVSVGSKVGIGDVLFIIESMKLMNEITSEISGTVTAILVTDGAGVEFGQPILIIE